MKKFIRDKLFGDVPVTEYCKVTVDGEIQERVFLNTGNKGFDVSATHWLLCLDPVVFGIWFERKHEIISFNRSVEYSMHFMDSSVHAGTVAVLKLDLLNAIEEQDGTLVLLRLRDASMHHISFIKTRLIYLKYYKKPEQNFYKLKSYAAAYSYPRRVRLVSFKEGEWYNIFPMDLVGDIPSSRRYVFGLRHSNVTLGRIIETKKLSVAEVPYEYKDIIYQLGKHHREPLSESVSPFEIVPSEFFGFPIPVWANSYKEIHIVSTMNLGSHMLIWGEEVNEKYLNEPHGYLFHIHFLHYLHQKKRGLIYQFV